MTNEEQKLREIAYKHAEPKVIWNDGNMSIYPDEEKIESRLSDLTALISENYTANEEVEKMVEERLRKELINLLRNKQVEYTYGVVSIEDIVDEYLKSREK